MVNTAGREIKSAAAQIAGVSKEDSENGIECSDPVCVSPYSPTTRRIIFRNW